MSKRVTVIGAGIAGLTTAFRLMQAGFKVSVFEASQHVGGAIRTASHDGFKAELGPNTVLETCPQIGELIEAAGLEDQRIYANEAGQKRFIVKGKKPIALPSSPPAFFMTPLFSVFAKLRLFKEPFIPSWDNSYEESLAEFVVRRLGQEFLDYAINPFVAGVYAGDPKDLSVQHGFAKLYALEQKYGGLIKGQIKGAKERKQRAEESKQSAKMISFKEGLSTLPETLAKLLGSGLSLGRKVTSLIQEKDQWSVQSILEDGTEQSTSADHVIYAGPIYALKEITLDGQLQQEFSELSEIKHPPVTTLTLGFKREQVAHALDGFGMLIPEVEGLNILGALFTSTLFPDRAPEGHVTITAFIGGTRQPEIALLEDSKLLEVVLTDLDTLLGVKGKPVFYLMKKWDNAIPQYNVGYGKYKMILSSLEQSYPGLHFTGNYCSGISVSDTIKHASELADLLVEKSKQGVH
ncbi:MAG: protoporphyrinogen oxidase [Candidatus Marinimicrobia bacterium]|nr:protoporphyrinogen oxidase [Candidatus Neomarinimicrobiota bacterium]